ncbi:exopolyphosphatase PRUNE1 [Canna indica]|uniref:Exopolyphosphatase PRUNE1 n=1 Tax=Canna indica TaxID=4628 RepID=A0AAQ3L008_9LILI|nr:exopolyphosphatase PRUNE1 [Canna indica]
MIKNLLKPKKPRKISGHQIHERCKSGSNLSIQENSCLSQDITISSLSCLNNSISETKSQNPELKSELEEILSLSQNNGQPNSEKDHPSVVINSSDAEKEITIKNSRPSFSSSSAQSAAAYYGSISLRNDTSILDMCESVRRLNQYLKATKADAKAGVPGKFLHAVIGEEAADVGLVVSTITYAFFLNETQARSEICVLPVINSKRADFTAHSELRWLLKTCQVLDESSLVFIDEIDLSYHNRFGNLKLILINGHKISSKQEFINPHCHLLIFMLNRYVIQYILILLMGFSLNQGGSCCTLVAEKYAETSPEILVGQGFSRLLLSGILLDTKNLTSTNCSSKDKYMATLLIKGAGRYGCSGLYQLLKYKMSDISDLKVQDIIRKDFKKWTRVSSSAGRYNNTSYIGMSSIGISVEELLKHEDSASNEVILFQESEKLQLLMIVSGYYDSQQSFKREILVSTHTPVLMRKFVGFLNINNPNLPLKSMNHLGKLY